MADVFISYAKEDRSRVAPLAKTLEGMGWSVWWDRKIPPGKTFSQVIAEAIDAAKCVLVLWSNDAIKSQWVQEEAAIAKERNILIPAILDPVKPPIGFGLIQAADLTDWKPASAHDGFATLLDAISDKAGMPAERDEPERPPQELKPELPIHSKPEPKEDAKPTTAETKTKSKGAMIAMAVMAVFIAAVGLWSMFRTDADREREQFAVPESVSKSEDGAIMAPKPVTEPVSKGEDVAKTAPKPAKRPKEITNSIDMKFVYIAPGTFIMGSPENEPGRNKDETQHQVTLTQGFYMQTTEVTQGQWQTVMGDNDNPPHFKKCGDDCPVESISWKEAQEFIDKLNQKESGRKYRLPTEAQWEYAVRAGTRTPYYTGNTEADLDRAGWYSKNSNQTPHPVARKEPNGWGLYDMHGNVWELCQDWYGGYKKESAMDPSGPPSGSDRVIRGGGWGDSAWGCRSAFRGRLEPDVRVNDLGFRLVLLPGQ